MVTISDSSVLSLVRNNAQCLGSVLPKHQAQSGSDEEDDYSLFQSVFLSVGETGNALSRRGLP